MLLFACYRLLKIIVTIQRRHRPNQLEIRSSGMSMSDEKTKKKKKKK